MYFRRKTSAGRAYLVPLEQATPGVKADLAEYILKAVAQGRQATRANSDNSLDAELRRRRPGDEIGIR
jgi:hypothetical protein